MLESQNGLGGFNDERGIEMLSPNSVALSWLLNADTGVGVFIPRMPTPKPISCAGRRFQRAKPLS